MSVRNRWLRQHQTLCSENSFDCIIGKNDEKFPAGSKLMPCFTKIEYKKLAE